MKACLRAHPSSFRTWGTAFLACTPLRSYLSSQPSASPNLIGHVLGLLLLLLLLWLLLFLFLRFPFLFLLGWHLLPLCSLLLGRLLGGPFHQVPGLGCLELLLCLV